MYYKQSKGFLLIHKDDGQHNWVQWVHHSEGLTHCPECLELDGCWFSESKAPPCPHHPYCHCTLEPISYLIVLANASTNSDYKKFDPYLFNPDNFYSHTKHKMFESWGYTVADAMWLKAEMEQQALEKYIAGDYKLGVLNKYGQRISIRIEIPRKNGDGLVSFISGWTVRPNGQLTLNTPYGGK